MLVEPDVLEAEGSALRDLIDPVACLVVHVHDLCHRRHLPFEAERRLAAAVLHEAIDDLGRTVAARVCEAWLWINERGESSYPYTFENICALLMLDASAARSMLWARFGEHVGLARAQRRAQLAGRVPVQQLAPTKGNDRMRWRHRNNAVRDPVLSCFGAECPKLKTSVS